mmetsp:Transcript_9338/g.23001  ORF Transcript_9338/g.23001 Transcript_9338/m.23001 type:complete len:325 (+) Transcript_9338:31-1005(+)
MSRNYIKKCDKHLLISNSLLVAWNVLQPLESFRLKIIYRSTIQITIELIGMDSTFINSIRRVLINDIPIIAIDEIFIFINTSILNDDMLAHRYGLTPLRIDPREYYFTYKNTNHSQKNSIIFLTKMINLSPRDKYTKHVLTSNIKWSPCGSVIPNQTSTYFTKKQSVTNKGSLLAFQDIIITKLKPKQTLFAEVHAIKGLGSLHAKYSPVASVWYSFFSFFLVLKNINYLKKKNLNSNILDYFTLKKFNATSLYEGSKHLLTEQNKLNQVNIDYLKDKCKYINILKRGHSYMCIESVGGLKPEFLLIESFNILIKKLDRLRLIY